MTGYIATAIGCLSLGACIGFLAAACFRMVDADYGEFPNPEDLPHDRR